jgi:hypothetical protein
MFVGTTSRWAVRTHGERLYPVVTKAEAETVLSEATFSYEN